MSIYAIECLDTGEVYFGSTINTIKQRMTVHCAPSNHCKSKQIIERGNYTVHILEDGFEDSHDLLHEAERFYIETFPCVNKQVPLRTHQENKAYQKEYNKEYQKANQDKIKVAQKEYYLQNKDNQKATYVDRKDKINIRRRANYLKKKQAKANILLEIS